MEGAQGRFEGGRGRGSREDVRGKGEGLKGDLRVERGGA